MPYSQADEMDGAYSTYWREVDTKGKREEKRTLKTSP
jgi:hypothetical protein